MGQVEGCDISVRATETTCYIMSRYIGGVGRSQKLPVPLLKLRDTAHSAELRAVEFTLGVLWMYSG